MRPGDRSHPPIPEFDTRAIASETEVAPRTIITVSFGFANLTGTGGATGLRNIEAEIHNVGLVAPYRGSVVALSINSPTTKTAGTSTFEARKNGTDLNAELVWPDGSNKASARFTPGQFSFAQDDLLQVGEAHASLSQTLDVIADLFLLLDPRSIS